MDYVPIQPISRDEQEVVRFQKNRIVARLLREGEYDLNDIARWDVSAEERQQFAMLIGYSLSGFGDLSYVSDETYDAAAQVYLGESEPGTAHLKEAHKSLEEFKIKMAPIIASLYGIHRDSLLDPL